ncbi:MAG: hypothetical protein ACK5MN_12920 [Lachnospiraceae bacterium]
MKVELLRVDYGVKKVGNVKWIRDFSIQMFQNEICGLITNNNLEQEFLVAFFAGRECLDEGWVYYNDRLLVGDESRRVFKKQLYVIRKRDALATQLSIFHNILIRQMKSYTEVLEAAKETGFPLDLEQMIDDLSVLERKMVELIIAYISGRRLIVLAELDEILHDSKAENFLQLILKLKEQGIDVLVISNTSELLFRLSDYIYIFMQGRSKMIMYKRDFDKKRLYSVISQTNWAETDVADYSGQQTVLSLLALQISDTMTMDIAIRRAQIVNFVDSAPGAENRAALLEVLEGRKQPLGGRIQLDHRVCRNRNYRSILKAGLAIIPEESYDKKAYFNTTVLDNICLVLSGKMGIRGMAAKYKKCIEEELVATGDFTIEELSQSVEFANAYVIQKMAYYRWILYAPKVIVCNKPFSTANYNMQQLTRHLIVEATRRGIAVMILCGNVSEASYIGNRIVMLRDGALHETAASELTNWL